MCGRANELYFLSKMGFSASYAATEPVTGMPHKMCYDFFKNFASTACVNIDLLPFPEDEFTGKQWCYVSNDCANLNGGGYATNIEGFSQSSWHNPVRVPAGLEDLRPYRAGHPSAERQAGP